MDLGRLEGDRGGRVQRGAHLALHLGGDAQPGRDLDLDQTLGADQFGHPDPARNGGGIAGRVKHAWWSAAGALAFARLYLLPVTMDRLYRKLLRELKPGTRIVSHNYQFSEWPPEKEISLEGHTLYFWRVPEASAEKPAARR